MADFDPFPPGTNVEGQFPGTGVWLRGVVVERQGDRWVVRAWAGSLPYVFEAGVEQIRAVPRRRGPGR